jgi:histidinol-phosphate/aromatic aminotransferase/cobyric acid decarboxylase-like protein
LTVSSEFSDFADSFFRPSISGLTPYQAGKPVEDVQRELGLARVIKLASNEGPFGPFPAAQEAIARATAELNRYPDGGVSPSGTALPLERSASAPARTAAST